MVRVRVISPGWNTTVQDLGRPGFGRFGIPISGAMDSESMALANQRAGNPPGAALLEGMGGGGAFEFLDNATAGVAGPGLSVTVNGQEVNHTAGFTLRSGDLIRLHARSEGMYQYLSIYGTLSAAEWLGSQSTCLVAGQGGFQGRALRKGDVVSWEDPAFHPDLIQEVSVAEPVDSEYPNQNSQNTENERNESVFSILPGPEWDWFGPVAREAFFAASFTISSQSNRSALRLEAPFGLSRAMPPLTSSPVCPGVIQWPPGGKPIIVMKDGQTIGGYPRIGALHTSDLSRLAQIRPGQSIRFHPT